VSSMAVMELQDTLPSSIIASIEENHTVAFIGTSDGYLLKVHLESTTAARLYERVPLDSSPVLSDVKIDEDTGVMHVLTEQKLIKMRVENCNQYTTCETCIGTNSRMDGDPYCGWCTLQRTCTRYSNCPLPDVSTRWLPYNAAQCIEITAVTPYDNLPITITEQQRTLTVQQLPDLSTNQNYECHFDEYASQATKNGDILNCVTPPSNRIPAIDQGGKQLLRSMGELISQIIKLICFSILVQLLQKMQLQLYSVSFPQKHLSSLLRQSFTSINALFMIPVYPVWAVAGPVIGVCLRTDAHIIAPLALDRMKSL
jgi:uncharacterized CHY-type Zn-finger protein